MKMLFLLFALFSGIASADNFILPDSTLIEGVAVAPTGAIPVLDADLSGIKDGSKYRVGGAVVARAAAAFNLARAQADAIAATNDYHAYQMAARTGNPTLIMSASYAAKMKLITAVLAGSTLDQFDTAYLNAGGYTTSALRTAWANSEQPQAVAYFSLLGKADALSKTSKARIMAATDAVTLNAAITQNRADAAAFIATLPVLP